VEEVTFFAALADKVAHRSARLADIEVSEWSEGFRFEGLAAVFDEAMLLPDYSESIERGAFRKILSAAPNVPMFVEHALKSDQIPLATTGAGTMKLEEAANGLKVIADVADTQLGRDLRTSVKRGDISGMSYGFVAGRENTKTFRRDGRTHRAITGFKRLLDVSPTWDPAYKGTSAEFRSVALALGDVPESTDTLQQTLSGLRQLEGGATDEVPTQEEAPSGVSPRLAARQRRLQLMSLTLEGGEHVEE
jgi:HK97 family phage prohead protease